MSIGAMCMGIGGLDIAAEHVYGAETAWCAEYDPHASKVIDAHWQIPNHGDITATDWANVEPVDIVTAGYPCQPFSTAGARQGTEDERHLWPAIRDAVRVLRPRIVVLENVAGHLSLGFDEVLADIAGLGFDAEWGVFRSSDIGAPHRRARLFVVATVAENVGHERARSARGGRGRPANGCEPAAAADGANGLPIDDNDRPGHNELHPRGFADRRCTDHHEPSDRTRTWGRYWPAIDRWERIIGRPAPHPVDDRGRLNPALPEWMMGYPAGWVTNLGLSRAAQLRCIGNAVQPQTAIYALTDLQRRT